MESTPQQSAEGKAVVTVLAAVLERLVTSNAHAATNPNGSTPEVTKFHALNAPGISIKQYLERVRTYQNLRSNVFQTFFNRFMIPHKIVVCTIHTIHHHFTDSQVCILFNRVLCPSSHIHRSTYSKK